MTDEKTEFFDLIRKYCPVCNTILYIMYILCNCQRVNLFTFFLQTQKKTEMELESKPFVIDTTKWKNELKCNGFILCDKESCQMGFLSLRGMEVHRQKCVGHVNEGVSIYAFCLQCVIA